MDTFTKDLLQAAAWGVAIVGGLIAAFKAIHETRESRHQRLRELRWRKAELARDVISSLFANVQLHNAFVMVDWSGRDFEIAAGRRKTIYWEDVPGALRHWVEPVEFNDKEIYIRDCFDELVDGLNLLEHYLRTDLLEFEDVEFPNGLLHRAAEAAGRCGASVHGPLWQWFGQGIHTPLP